MLPKSHHETNGGSWKSPPPHGYNLHEEMKVDDSTYRSYRVGTLLSMDHLLIHIYYRILHKLQ